MDREWVIQNGMIHITHLLPTIFSAMNNNENIINTQNEQVGILFSSEYLLDKILGTIANIFWVNRVHNYMLQLFVIQGREYYLK